MTARSFARPRGAVSCAVAVVMMYTGMAFGQASFTMLNAGDPHPSWAAPRINDVGHVVMVRAITSSYSGHPWLWTDDGSPLTAYPGAYVSNASRTRPRLQINDNDVIATNASNETSHLYDLAGEVSLAGSPVTMNYVIDINNSGQIAGYSASGATGRRCTLATSAG